MPYLTLFTLPKPFLDAHVSLIQRNALESWRLLGPDVEVLVLGDDAGVAETAAEYGALHVGNAKTNERGTPLLDWAFREAAARGSGELLCYVNADIVLLEDFLVALRRLPGEFLAIGQRWDCGIDSPIDFANEHAPLAEWARKNCRLDLGRGSDYFAFRNGTDFGLPPFAVGRPGWDNWMIGRALELGLPLIDLTPSTTVIHQNHDYGHVAEAKGVAWEGPEADRNRRLGGLDRYIPSTSNATHLLTADGLRRARTLRHLRARVERLVALSPAAGPVRRVVRLARRA
jgi:hypothetical protein